MTLHTQEIQTLAQVQAFVSGRAPLVYIDGSAGCLWLDSRYAQAVCLLCPAPCLQRRTAAVSGQGDRAVAGAGYSLHPQFTDGGVIRVRRRAPAVPFVQRYPAADIRLLAEMDTLHGTLSGTTTRKLGERAFSVHGDVDEVTQSQAVFAVEHISEAYLLRCWWP